MTSLQESPPKHVTSVLDNPSSPSKDNQPSSPENSSSNENGPTSNIGPKRRRTYGSFACDHSGCTRVFTRADHLSRHKKNHDPKKLRCLWPGCGLQFARNDIREKHFQRHLARVKEEETNRESPPFVETPGFVTFHADPLNTSKEGERAEQIDSILSTHSQDQLSPSYPQNSNGSMTPNKPDLSSHIQDPHPKMEPMQDNHIQSHPIQNLSHNHFYSNVLHSPKTSSERSNLSSESKSSSDKQPLDQEISHNSHNPELNKFNEVPTNPAKDLFQTPQNHLENIQSAKPLSPSDLIEWLFHDDSFSRGDKMPASEFYNFPNEVSPVSSLIENVFAITPKFPHSSSRTSIDDSTRHTLVTLIPSLTLNPDFGLPQIERCLELYWLIYHPQYPILHRPSFSNREAHPLLLLAMIMVGASLSGCSGQRETLFTAPQKLAEHIAEPLRWLIFSHADCKPPAKVYIVQSLLLLESFEITSTSRFLHERSFLYHGTKIQLLRRSPILGGDPLKKDVDDEDPHVWNQWIEFESMKRACLMAFYLDTVNSTVYGHTIILYAYQIKLSLPCEDSLWEYDNEDESKLGSLSGSLQSPKFLDALKALLHRQHVRTSTFGKSILLAGLLTIMFQMQQKDLQLSFLEWDSMKESWNEIISLAIDVWRVEVCPNGCFDTATAFSFSPSEIHKLPPMLRLEDTRCKFSLYHIAQIYMRITHYDYIVYAGAPSRMNVKVTDFEYKNVERRVRDWSSGVNGRISVVHAYLFLCEMLLSPHDDDISYTYDPNTDPFLHRKNIIASAVLVIFAYNFTLQGPESNFFGSIGDNSFYPDREDAYSYLRRIRRHFSQCISGPIHRTKYDDPTEYHSTVKKFADYLPNIENKHHMAGLLKMFHKSFENCNWEVGREYSKLFRNCIERCLGRNSITCLDMYS